jgi:hypothetical protein
MRTRAKQEKRGLQEGQERVIGGRRLKGRFEGRKSRRRRTRAGKMRGGKKEEEIGGGENRSQGDRKKS